jgi:hypothetical protein
MRVRQFFIKSTLLQDTKGEFMAGSTISVDSVEIALTSAMGSLSAREMKEAYLQPAGKVGEDGGTVRHPRHSSLGRERTGPHATVYLTMLAGRTRAGDVKKLLHEGPGRIEELAAGYYYTLTFIAGIQLDDPSTTRFINATVSWEVPEGSRILEYSPKGKEVMGAIIGSGGCGISVSPLLDFRGMEDQEAEDKPGNPVRHFVVRLGPKRQFQGAFSGKNGFDLPVPPGYLLEYQGMRKNERAVDWELYPPMIPRDGECAGKENLAVFSLIIQTPRREVPAITARVEGRVKGDLWGVIHLTGSVTFPHSEE